MESDLKQIQAELTLERTILDTIFEESPAALALWVGPDLVFEKVNSNYQAIFPGRQLRGLPFLEALPEFEGQPFKELLTRVFETGEPFVGKEILARHPRVPGGPLEDVYYDFTYLRINDANGKPYGVFDHALDVTARVRTRRALTESESRFRQLADSLPQIIWTARPDGFLDYYNERWYEFTGNARGTEGDTSWAPIIHPDDLPAVKDAWYHSVRTGEPYQIELRFKDSNRA